MKKPSFPGGHKIFETFGASGDRDIVLLPDVILQEVTENIPKVLRPKFDALWNTGGFDGSRSYDNAGNWHDPDNR